MQDTTNEPSALRRFQELLRTLFQFDLSDLDFGVYRLFRLKQAELKAFIEKQLPEAADKAFSAVLTVDTRHLSEEVARLAGRIREEIDPDALQADGSIGEDFRNIKAKAARDLITEYESKKAQLDLVRVSEDQKQDVFNHLFNFFFRYYDAGDRGR